MRTVRNLLYVLSLILVAWPMAAIATREVPVGAAYSLTALRRADPGALTRSQEPVIIGGDELPVFDGAALDDLFVYAYAGAAWQQIPFQLDEVDASGTYTVENGVLGADDELVFMAMDLGEQATATDWITDTDSQSYARYEIQVSDPLNPGQQAWAYLYRSTTLSPALPADYVSWDAANQRLVGSTYAIGFSPTTHAAMDSMKLNGSGTDALDRGKIRIVGTCWVGPIPIDLTLNEEDLAGSADPTPDIDGPVRVGGGSTDGSSWAYHSLYRSDVAMNIDDLTPPPPCTAITIDQIRLSSDWLDPAASGMAPTTYYDDNTPAGVTIDGVPDSVPAMPAAAWKQVGGGQGSIVQVVDVTIGAGQVANYYRDDQALDPNDTGDGRSFGDAGFVVSDPGGQVSAETVTFFLGPELPNVGTTYYEYYANPLQVTATAQSYGVRYYVFLPLAARDSP
jgi:hypothetical protein